MNSKLKCKCCGEYYEAGHDWIKTPAGRFYNYDHMQVFVKAKNALKLFRAQNKAKKEKKKVDAVFDKMVRDNDFPRQIRLTQDVFNKLRVLQEKDWFNRRGIDPYCISCGGELGGDQWANGHYKTAGGHFELRFDPKNSFLQHNKRCNRELSADIEGTKTTIGYKNGLIHRFGQEEGQAILDYCEKYHEPKNYTCDDLIKMRKEFSKEIRRLEKLLC